jgi:hypothetical protein
MPGGFAKDLRYRLPAGLNLKPLVCRMQMTADGEHANTEALADFPISQPDEQQINGRQLPGAEPGKSVWLIRLAPCDGRPGRLSGAQGPGSVNVRASLAIQLSRQRRRFFNRQSHRRISDKVSHGTGGVPIGRLSDRLRSLPNIFRRSIFEPHRCAIAREVFRRCVGCAFGLCSC